MSWWIKALAAMRHASGWTWTGAAAPAQAAHDYTREVGTGLDASVVMAPVQWLQRTVPSAPIAVETADDEGRRLPDHPLAALLARPNPAYSLEHLLAATVFSLCTGGNAYWLKVRNGGGRPAELWYAPHWLVTPRWPQDGSQFVSSYEYSPGGDRVRLETDDVVHFRCGVDPRNLRLGLAPLAPVLREIWADMEVATFVGSILRNSGIPGLVISPDGQTSATTADVDAIKRYLAEQFTGSRRGAPLVFSSRTKVERVAWNPQELDLSHVSDRAEERVCALLGVPPVVVGLHAGTSQTAVGATMREQVRIAWQSGVIPTQSLIAAEIARALVPDMDRTQRRLRVYFDTSEVEALSEETDKLVLRAERLMRAGMVTVAEARQMLGMESDERHEIYLRPMGMTEIPGATNRAPAPIELAAAVAAERKHAHSPLETRIAATAARAESTPEMEAFVVALELSRRRLSARWARTLAETFEALGEAAASAARPALEEFMPSPAKSELLDEMITDRVIEALALPGAQRLLAQRYEQHYLKVARSVPRAARAVGLAQIATDLTDRVMRSVIATGGRRAGLVDLTAQTRARILREVAEQRAEGAGVDQIVRAIRDGVPAGPWASSQTRAEVIARTETKYAQNVSVVEHARANAVERFRVYDARLGPTDEICEALDGAIVTAAEATELCGAEHPNGTRSLAPYFD